MTSVKYDYNFLAGIFTDDNLIFNSYNLSLHLYINTESIEDQQIAFNRMDFIIYNIITNSVFVIDDDIKTIKKYKKAEIPILTVSEPGPIDQIILITIVNKLNMVTENVLKIFESEISSSVGGYVKYMYYSNDEIDDDEALVSTDISKWWNDSNPRFIDINENSTICKFNQLSNWQEHGLNWNTDSEILDTKNSNIININFSDNEN